MTEDGGIAWRRVSRGILIGGLGVFLLLTTTGRLPWSFWLDSLTLWPVVLIALGIRVIFARSRMSWAVVLSPLLILGTLAYVARTGFRVPPYEPSSLEVNRDPGVQEWTLDGGFAFADLDLRAAPLGAGLLVKGEVARAFGAPPHTTTEGRSARVRLGWESRRGIRLHTFPSRRSHWDLRVAQDLPLRLDLEMGFVSGDIDLSSAGTDGIRIDGGFNDLTVHLGAPAAPTRLDFEGAFNRIELIVPPGTPVSASTDGLLSVVRGRTGAGSLQGPPYRLHVEGAFNSVTVRSP